MNAFTCFFGSKLGLAVTLVAAALGVYETAAVTPAASNAGTINSASGSFVVIVILDSFACRLSRGRKRGGDFA